MGPEPDAVVARSRLISIPESDLRNQSNSANNGISESTKKIGPPRWWSGLSIISRFTLTVSQEITVIRKAFRKTPKGKTDRTNRAFFQPERRKRCEARMLVMKRTRVE